ncbi:Hypothetical predicted protein [Pelobates cultripes]|uniref:Uncharacterized protein n=1 Tax=Pelobates cultripes TaxID=61616 RepID=A0AAD1RLC4_PELCU|nr:Hypothetical predicted protein [Pelobates cultripes]
MCAVFARARSFTGTLASRARQFRVHAMSLRAPKPALGFRLQQGCLRQGGCFRVCAAHAQLTSGEFARSEHARIGGDVRYDVTRLFKRQKRI